MKEIALDVAIWRAVSSRPQLEKSYYDDQARMANDEIAKLRGQGISINVIEWLEVAGQSRSIDSIDKAAESIEAYARLIELAQSKAINCLMYPEYSRLGRDLILLEQVSRMCISNDIIMYDLSRPPRVLEAQDTGAEILNRIIQAYQAQDYVKRLAELSKIGMEKRARSGRMPRGKKYGYTPDGKIIESEARIIRMILIDMYLGGHGGTYILRKLNDMEIPSPRGKSRWSLGTVSRLTQSAWTYAGYIEYNVNSKREYIRAPGLHEPIIDESDAAKIELEMKIRSDAKRLGSASSRWSGMIYCGVCENRMNLTSKAWTNSDGSRTRRQYFKCRHCRPNRQTTIDDIDTILKRRLKEEINRYHLIEVPPVDNTEELRSLHNRLRAIPQRIATIDTDRADGLLDRERYIHQLERINAEKDAIEHRIQQIEAPPPSPAESADVLNEYIHALDFASDTEVNMWLRPHIAIVFTRERTWSIRFLS